MLQQGQLSKKDKLIQRLSVVIAILLLATPLTCGYFNGKKYHEMLTHNSMTVNGIVTGYEKQYKMAMAITYTFTLNGVAYFKQSSGNQNDYESLINHFAALRRKAFPVLVNKEKPQEYSKMLITPDDFDDYNIAFPDSLNFVRKIVDNWKANKQMPLTNAYRNSDLTNKTQRQNILLALESKSTLVLPIPLLAVSSPTLGAIKNDTPKVEQLIRLTNSEDFIDNWAFFVTGLNLVPRTGKMIVSLEAFYDQFDEQFEGHKKSWKIACDGFFDHRLHAGYLRPFYQIKILTDHPILWNYGAETFFSIQGSCKNIPSLMGDLFLVHSKVCGNWIEFHNVFGFLPEILETGTDNQLAAPTPLWQHYFKKLEQHNVNYTVNETQQNQQLSALFFGSVDFPDNYNYGQPYVAAETFEVLESA